MRRKIKKIIAIILVMVVCIPEILISELKVEASSKRPYLTIVLDPGHDSTHAGARGNGIVEEEANLTIAKYCKEELETYEGVEVFMTRENASCPFPSCGNNIADIKNRVEMARTVGADAYVSLHLNSSYSSSPRGAGVYAPSNNVEGKELARSILNEIVALGLNDRGVTEDDEYAVVNKSIEAGLPGIIVEHAFLSNASDANTYLKTENDLKKLGVADATGIAKYYGLNKKISDEKSNVTIKYQAHIQDIGWQGWRFNGEVSGTEGQALRMEGISILLKDSPYEGDIEYRAHVQNIGWQEWKKSGELAGTTGRALQIEAIQIRLTGELAEHYEVVYRSHVQDVGWQNPVSDMGISGTEGLAARLESLTIQLLERQIDDDIDKDNPENNDNLGSDDLEDDDDSDNDLLEADLSYGGHVEDIGDVPSVTSGNILGTTGKSLRMEGIVVNLNSAGESWEEALLQYRVHIQDIGWQEWKKEGEYAGTKGQAKQLEAIELQLAEGMNDYFDIYYRCHVQNIGWMGWAKNGESAGTSGFCYQVEAVQIMLIKKGEQAPENTVDCYRMK